ncbi:MAG TPA: M23 family metallopeptidase [Gemmatimonadales bacterium]|nr:M23 family metallopeptidase [Gemmatimonadales bacterium]
MPGRPRPPLLFTGLARGFSAVVVSLATAVALAAQDAPPAVPALPDSTGWGVHVLTVARDPGGALWVGTYGQGMFRLPPGAQQWERIRHDTTAASISMDFVQAIAFGSRGQVWYGTIGNGWGLSLDGGRTWKNWTYDQLGPEWQYVIPDGIVARGDTVVVATADGLQITTDDGAHWTAIGDAVGPAARGPADTALPLLTNEYVRRVAADRRGWNVTTLRGNQRIWHSDGGWKVQPVSAAAFPPANAILIGRQQYRGTRCGLRPIVDTLPCLRRSATAAGEPKTPLTAWLARPIARTDNAFIDQTYRYGSTMGGFFQQHQGVEFNNPDGTPVSAALGGRVVYAGPAEAGARTVAIRHDTTVVSKGTRYRLYSIYYHNSSLAVKVGQRVKTGQTIARVGNTGRATNDHLHLELAASPTDSTGAIVDSLQRFPPYTVNPELWLEPLAGSGIVAGQVLDTAGAPVPQARIYGLVKRDPIETPFSYAETYGDKAHGHPLYGEHFAVSDVPAGTYVVGTEIDGAKVYRKVRVEAGKLTWVVFKP